MNDKTENRLRDDLRQLEDNSTSKDLFQLAQGRNSALSQSRQNKKSFLWPALATSLTSVALIVVLVNPEKPFIQAESISATNIQVDEPLIDLYEDLDFYHWLASAET
jgi:hypothetical protein